MKALIYQSELDYISQCILDYPEIETGGDLFGFWTYSGFPVIQYVIGPGPNTYRTGTFFKQDKDFLIQNGNYLNRKHGLQHLGNWHSHHQLGLPHPSSHDSNTINKAIEDNSLKQFFLIIGSIERSTTNINGFQYLLGQGTAYTHAPWVILNEVSPIRKDILCDQRLELYYEPISQEARIGKLFTTSLKSSTTYYEPLEENSSVWFSLREGKEFIRKTLSDFEKIDLRPKMFKTSNNQFIFNLDNVKIIFPLGFPNENPNYVSSDNSQKGINTIEKIITKTNRQYGQNKTTDGIQNTRKILS